MHPETLDSVSTVLSDVVVGTLNTVAKSSLRQTGKADTATILAVSAAKAINEVCGKHPQAIEAAINTLSGETK